MGKVTIITESVLAWCDNCEAEFTPRIARKIHTCPDCRTAVLGAEDVPLRGPGVRKVIKKTVEKAAGADAVISKKPNAK